MIFDIIFERVQNIENKIQVSIAKYTKKGMRGVAESFDEYMKDAEGNLIQEDHPEKSYLIKSPDNYFIMKGKVKVWFKWKEGDPFQAEHVASWNEEGNKEHSGFETLINEKLFFAGIDVIGNYLTEINVTSPTCIQEIKKLHKIDVAKIIFDKLDE